MNERARERQREGERKAAGSKRLQEHIWSLQTCIYALIIVTNIAINSLTFWQGTPETLCEQCEVMKSMEQGQAATNHLCSRHNEIIHGRALNV